MKNINEFEQVSETEAREIVRRTMRNAHLYPEYIERYIAKDFLCDAATGIKKIEEESKELLEALKRLQKEMTTCMTGYQQAVRIPGDIANSVLFQCFRDAMEQATNAIAKTARETNVSNTTKPSNNIVIYNQRGHMMAMCGINKEGKGELLYIAPDMLVWQLRKYCGEILGGDTCRCMSYRTENGHCTSKEHCKIYQALKNN